MGILRNALPMTAVLIVLVSMAYANIVIIGDLGRMTSFIPFLLVILVWLGAILRTRGEEHVR